jgi:hypothetical protein
MHYTGMRLLESGLLTEAEATEARALIERDRRGYAQGVAVVDCDARWTEPGQAALSSAKAYMTAQLRS